MKKVNEASPTNEDELAFFEFWYGMQTYADTSWLQNEELQILCSQRGLVSHAQLCEKLNIIDTPDDIHETHKFEKHLKICHEIGRYLNTLKGCLFPTSLEQRADNRSVENIHQALSINKRRVEIADDISDQEQVAVNCLLLALCNLPTSITSRIKLCINQQQVRKAESFLTENILSNTKKSASLSKVFNRLLAYADNNVPN